MIISFLLHFLQLHNQYCQMISYNSCDDFQSNWEFISSNPAICSTSELFGGNKIFDSQTRVWKVFYDQQHDCFKLRVSIQCFQFNLRTDVGQVRINIDGNSYILQCKLYPLTSIVAKMQNNNFVFVYLFVETNIFWGIDMFSIQFYRNDTTKNLFVEKEQNFLTTTLVNNQGWLDQTKSFKIQNLMGIEVLGSNIENQFYLCKQFLLPFQINEVSIQFNVFIIDQNVQITLDVLLNDQIFSSVQPKCAKLFPGLTCCLFNLQKSIYFSRLLFIQIINRKEITIEGIRDFKIWQIDEWNLVNQLKICIPTCVDMIITYNEECDDGNNIPYDGCYNCRFQCDLECKKCSFGKCLDITNKKNIIQIEIENCKVDSYNSDSGIYYDFKYQTCLARCGDGVIALNEQCDDRNDTPYDGCHLCQFQCSLHCLNCKNGICIQCVNGYQLNQNQCEAIVGIKQLLKMNNVMMEIKFNQKDVIFVNLIVKPIVQIVQIIIIVLNVQMDGIQITDNVNKHVMIINQLSYQLNNVMIHQINIVLIVKYIVQLIIVFYVKLYLNVYNVKNQTHQLMDSVYLFVVTE